MSQPRMLRQRLGAGLEWVLEVCGGLVLMLLMMLTTVDVIGRYVFNAPARGAFELTELTLAVLIFAGLPLVSRHQEHVVVDLLEERMPRLLRRLLDRASNLICASALLGLAYLLWKKAVRLGTDGDYTSVLKVPYAPFVYMMSVLVVISAIVHLVYCVRPPVAPGAATDTTI
jgi:TRAP-type C4-dicarboxylate transport system permease small subunit